MTSEKKNTKDFSIPLPYGNIAVRAWGNEKGTPVLALHGWQDNLGTFERLVPLLSSSLYIVAFDAPGHGLSSHKPSGCFYHYVESLIDIKRVVDFLEWTEFSFIGHSLGGTLALLYASVYPENVSGVVLLDILKPFSRQPEHLPEVTKRGIEGFLLLELKLGGSAPVYTYEKARDRLMEGTHQQITKESADILLKRSCKPSECGKGVVFTRDIRLKVTQDLQRFSHESLKAYMNKIRCNLIAILTESFLMYESIDPNVSSEFVSIYEKNCKSFAMIRIEGSHYVHLNDPERVAPIINKFFYTHSGL